MTDKIPKKDICRAKYAGGRAYKRDALGKEDAFRAAEKMPEHLRPAFWSGFAAQRIAAMRALLREPS